MRDETRTDEPMGHEDTRTRLNDAARRTRGRVVIRGAIAGAAFLVSSVAPASEDSDGVATDGCGCRRIEVPAWLDDGSGSTSGEETSTTVVSTSAEGTTEVLETSTEWTGSSESGSESTTAVVECGDGACGEGEDGESCYADCGACGDGKVEGPEGCDNGVNGDEAWMMGEPGAGACAAGCVLVGWCGDGAVNGPEACDGGGQQTAECEASCEEARCGDGVWNAGAGEACDDGNEGDGDGCAGDCKAEERRVFVTSGAWKGDMGFEEENPEGLEGMGLADWRCGQLAEVAGLGGSWKAWLSDGAVTPAERMDVEYGGLYRLVSEGYPVVAKGWGELTDGTLEHAVDADEWGVLTEENVWTNTKANGTRASEEDCGGWKVKDNTSTVIGQSSAKDATWSESLSGQACSGGNRLYCFED